MMTTETAVLDQPVEGLGDTLDETKLATFKAHVLAAIKGAVPGQEPFRHLYIEDILPQTLYDAVRARMFHHKYQSKLLDRAQDSHLYTNKRFSLVRNMDVETQYFRPFSKMRRSSRPLSTSFSLPPIRRWPTR